jgi:hypothetical protein
VAPDSLYSLTVPKERLGGFLAYGPEPASMVLNLLHSGWFSL